MKVLVIVATLLSCSLAAPTELLQAHELPKVETIEYKPVAFGANLIHHPFTGYHGLPLAHTVDVKEAEGEEVALPYHHGPAHLPVIHAAPHHYSAEVRTFAIDHAPVAIPHVEPTVVEVAGPTSVHHTSYHAETKRVEHPVEINHHQVQHVQSYVHHAPAVVHHAPAVVHHTPAAVHHAPLSYHHAAPFHHSLVHKADEE